MIAYFCTFMVGGVFLFSGFIKALSSRSFTSHVFSYRLIPPKLVVQAAIAFIGVECALGVALMLHLFPQGLVLGSILLLLGFAALTLWGDASGRIEDCGCYGGILLVTPRQSVLLDMGYILLLGIAWLFPVTSSYTGAWKILLTLLALVAGIVLGWRSRQEPLLDLFRLKVGKQWKPGWLKNISQDLQEGSYFVVFMSEDCPYCKKWVPLLNFMDTQKDFPYVMGIMSLVHTEMDRFKAQHLVRFPLVKMDGLLFRSMTDAFPTAALIENGLISNKWVGEIPDAYFERIKQFYESISLKSEGKARPFGG